jgi:hypothetical protein
MQRQRRSGRMSESSSADARRRHKGEPEVMKVYIHPTVTGEIRDRLKALLEEIGCDIIESLDQIDVGEEGLDDALTACGEASEGADQDDAEEEEVTPEDLGIACVVVLSSGTAEADFEPVLTEAVGRRCRIVGIWGDGADGDASALADYGADTVPWDAPRIRDAVCGVPQHQAPDGSSMPKPKAKHGGC